MDDKKIAKLESLLKLVDESITKEDFVKSFENVISLVIQIQKNTGNAIDRIEETYNELMNKIKSDNTLSLEEIKSQANKKMASLRDGIDGKDGRDGIDGKDGNDGKDGKDGSPDTPEQVRDKLESLTGEERLDFTAIKGLENIKEEGKEIKFVGGSRGVYMYIDGTKYGLMNTVNLVGGTGITLTYNRSSGRNDITINASSTPLSVLTATGDVDDSNVTFTFASEPKVVIVNGATYRNGHGCTISTTTVTLDNPVGTGGDIYALG